MAKGMFPLILNAQNVINWACLRQLQWKE